MSFKDIKWMKDKFRIFYNHFFMKELDNEFHNGKHSILGP